MSTPYIKVRDSVHNDAVTPYIRPVTPYIKVRDSVHNDVVTPYIRPVTPYIKVKDSVHNDVVTPYIRLKFLALYFFPAVGKIRDNDRGLFLVGDEASEYTLIRRGFSFFCSIA
jgi:methyl coenzyme M reductase gamma subunit